MKNNILLRVQKLKKLKNTTLKRDLMKNKIYPREKYLSKIRPFYDSDIVKVITGIRRSGKSTLLKSVIEELEKRSLQNRIIYLPLDKRGYKDIVTPEQLEKKIEEYIKDSGMYYLFIDEVQNVQGFEKVVLQYEEEGYSIFVTGSNSYLLSDEISAKLTTLKNYIELLKKAKIVYECNRFDLKSKKSLLREQKYYLTDLALYFSTNVNNNINYGPSLENLVYLFLISNGYQVSVGRIGKFECDFIVRKKW